MKVHGFESGVTPESIEKGINVNVSIDLIRHPEKDPATGKLTQNGKDAFFAQLNSDLGDGKEYDIVKFYVSPLSRGQEAKESINRFMEVSGVNTSIRDGKELVGKFQDVGSEFKEAITSILEQKGQLTKEQVDAIRERDTIIPAHEPASKDFETKTNELLLSEFFDTIIPGTSFTGKEHAEVLKGLIDHFSELTSRLKSGSKVKLVLVSHSGVIEYLTKYVYLQNHPELKAGDVGVDDIGGLVDFSQGPEINISSDDKGEKKISFKFKNLDLVYDPNISL
jgi:hypothetical protein